MRDIDFLAVHCTATPIFTSIDSIKNYWKNELGWKNPGYHYIIEYDGTVTELLTIDKVSNGVKGFNSRSINIAYVGGLNGEDTRTEAQKNTLEDILMTFKYIFKDAEIMGHCEFPNVTKTCPNFYPSLEYNNITQNKPF